MAALVHKYGGRAFQFAYRLTDNVEDAHELVQEAYRRAFERWDQYNSRFSLENWFFGILRHLYLDAKKRFERNHVIPLDAPVYDDDDQGLCLADTIEDQGQDVLALLEKQESAELVQRAFEDLPYEQRAALTMCDMEGMEYDAIAKVLDTPIGTVRSRIARARQTLKRSLLRDQGALNYHYELLK